MKYMGNTKKLQSFPKWLKEEQLIDYINNINAEKDSLRYQYTENILRIINNYMMNPKNYRHNDGYINIELDIPDRLVLKDVISIGYELKERFNCVQFYVKGVKGNVRNTKE